MRAIPELANEIAVRYYEIPKEQRNGKCQVSISTSFFVPKPFTPFQWAPMYPKEGVSAASQDRQRHHEGAAQSQEPSLSLARGRCDRAGGNLCPGRPADRRRRFITPTRSGCIFDAWGDFFDAEKWDAAFEKSRAWTWRFTLTGSGTSTRSCPGISSIVGIRKDFFCAGMETGHGGYRHAKLPDDVFRLRLQIFGRRCLL